MNSCPNKASKEWKTLVDQVGEDLSWATWAYYGYNYPATLNNVSSLKRALSIKSPCSKNQYLKLAERVTKYNNKYGTAHSFTPVQVGQADLYDIDLKINYLPKKVVIKTVYQGDNSVLGNEYTKAFINNNPEVFISEGNQYIINGEVYGSYEDAINSSLDYDRPFAEKLFRNYEKDFIPADKDKVYELLALAKNQGISGVLNHIISNTKDPIIKIFAKAFLDNIDRAGFLQIKFDVARDRYGNYVQDASGSYGGGIININWKKVFFNATNLIHKNGLDSGYKSIIHELVHVYTLQALRNPQTSKEKEFKNKITKAYNTLKQDAAFKSDYGLSSVEEFISEIISNPEFRGTLNIYKAGFLAKIINYIAKLFGYTKDISMEESNRASIIHETVNTFLKDLPYLTPSKGKSIYYDKVNNIKPGVSELFESNPELANQIYEALGFQGSISLESNLKNTGKTEKELTDYLKNKYPEIKLNISNNPIWEQSSDIVKNQEEYNKKVQYRLKATEILLSDKAKQVFNKGKNNKWSLDKILSELAIPKEQKQIILNLNDEDYSFANFDLRESIILALASNYSYTVEINTAKTSRNLEDTPTVTTVYRDFDYEGELFTKRDELDFDGEYKEVYRRNGNQIKRAEFIEFAKKAELVRVASPTQYYSNLAVPGGTNYTENEISTPLITPSIKGHAQFSTNNGIGWFRSDDKTVDELKGNWIKSESELPNEFIYSGEKYFKENGEWQTKNRFIEDIETVIWRYNMSLGNERIQNKPETKTRRILELQSDLFQKGRDKEDLRGIPTNNVITANLFDNEEFSFELNGYEYEAFVENIYYVEENQIEPTTVYYKNGVKISKKEMQIAKEEYKKQNIPQSQNQFLQLLNKDNNWVTFFIKSIIQDSAKKGYEKVLFPKGETAANIEGHETLAERLRVIDKELSLKDKNHFIVVRENDVFGESSVEFDSFDDAIKFANDNTTNKDIWSVRPLYKITPERVKELEKKKQEIESQGIEKLKPIEAFYEIKVGNILEKQFGKDNVKTITDEYGNQWREISINQSRDLDNILLQKNEANRIIGQANIKAMTVLIDSVNKKEDTIPHEYAHHYIAWFRNTPIVQEAIKRFGSEEALVQAIGEQVVKQKGEAYNWWKKFTNWILNLLSDKQLLQVLTDSFLNRQDLHDFTYNQPNTQQKQQAQQQYSEYLDTIFPDSKVKDIVYHGSNERRDYLDPGKQVRGRFGKGVSFASTIELVKQLIDDAIIHAAIIDLKNPLTDIPDTRAEVQPSVEAGNHDGVQVGKIEYTVPTKEQIHILGSKQDIEGFKNWVNSRNNQIQYQYSTSGIKPGVSRLFESNPELANAVYEAAGFKKNLEYIVSKHDTNDDILIKDKIIVTEELQNIKTNNYDGSINMDYEIIRERANEVAVGDTIDISDLTKPRTVTINDVLESFTISDENKYLLEKLKPIIEDIKIEYIRKNIFGNGVGMYSDKYNTIRLLDINSLPRYERPNISKQEVFFHELLHAATFRKIVYFEEGKQGLSKDELAALNELESIRKILKELGKESTIQTKKKGIIRNPLYGYSTDSIHEIISYAFTNKEFRNTIADIHYKGSKSILDKLIELIANIFGVKENTVLHALLANTEVLLENNQITPQQKQQAQELYSKYLNTIFPNSKVKDIVYRGDENFNVGEKLLSRVGGNKYTNGIYFTKSKREASGYINDSEKKFTHVFSAILDLKNPKITDVYDKEINTNALTEVDINNLKSKNIDGLDIGLSGEQGFEYLVFEPEQIHILGSNQDIQGFKEFVNNSQNLQNQNNNQNVNIVEDLLPAANNNPSVGNPLQNGTRFQAVIDSYIERSKALRNSIARLKVKRKESNDPVEKANLYKRISKLQKAINEIESTDPSNPGLIKKVSQISALENIIPYAEAQLKNVRDILKADKITIEDLKYAEKIVALWIKAGDFSGREHLFWTQSELEDSENNPVLQEALKQFSRLKIEADIIKSTLINPIRENIAKKSVEEQFGKKAIPDLHKAIRDVNWGTMQALDISEVNNPLVQAMHSYLKKANFKAFTEATTISETIDTLIKKIGKVNWDLFKQTFSNTDNRETGNLVYRFSQVFFDERSTILSNARASKNTKARAQAYKKLVKFNADKTIIFDVRKLFPGYWNTTFTQQEIDAHIKELKDTLGEYGYNKFYEKAKENIDKYILDLESQKQIIEDNNTNNGVLNKAAYDIELASWIRENSPAAEAEIYSMSSNDINNMTFTPSGTYSVKVPRRVINGKDTGYYDKKFETIESNEDLRNLYEILFDTINELKAVLPYEDTKWMQINSLPTVYKNILDQYGEDGMAAGLNPLMDALAESSRTSDLSTTDYRYRNLSTGDPDKHIQTSMMIDYNNKIKELVKLKIVEYKLENNSNPSMDQINEFKKDAANKIAQEKSFDLGKVTKMYALMALSYKHKAAIQHIMESLEHTIKNTPEIGVNPADAPLYDKNGNPIKLNGRLSNLSTMLDTFMDYYYGYKMDKPFGKTKSKIYTTEEKEKKDNLEEALELNEKKYSNKEITEAEYNSNKEVLTEMLEMLGGVRTWSKYGDMFLQYVQVKGMGWNIFAGITNMLYGFISNLIEASDGRNYDQESFWKAQSKVLRTVGGNKFTDEAIKIRSLMKKLDILKDSRYELYDSTSQSAFGKFKKKFKALNPYTPQTSTEFINQATVLVAMMIYNKVEVNGSEIPLYDCFDKNGELKEGIALPEDFDLADFKIRVDKVIKLNHGNYDPDSPLNLKRQLLGRALSQFRTWSFQGFSERFMGEMYDYQLGMVRKGRYRSYVDFYKTMKDNDVGYIASTFYITKQLLRKASFGVYNTEFGEIQGLSEVDAANMRKNMTELVVLAMLTAVALLLKGLVDKDRKGPKYLAYFYLNQITRLSTDLMFYTSPSQFEKLTRNAMPAFSAVIDLEDAMAKSINYIVDNESDEIKTGVNAHKSKAFRAINKVVPNPYSGLGRVMDAAQTDYSTKPIK